MFLQLKGTNILHWTHNELLSCAPWWSFCRVFWFQIFFSSFCQWLNFSETTRMAGTKWSILVMTCSVLFISRNEVKEGKCNNLNILEVVISPGKKAFVRRIILPQKMWINNNFYWFQYLGSFWCDRLHWLQGRKQYWPSTEKEK